MTEQFASMELARLYESQGYLEDALSMFQTLAQEESGETLAEAREAVGRIGALLNKDGMDHESPPQHKVIDSTVIDGEKDRNDDQIMSREGNIAGLLEKWLMLMVVQKRIRLFKSIRNRL